MKEQSAAIVGSGIGGLVAGALLARYGWQVTVYESHSIAGGAAHAFERDGYTFDSGPSFFCGLGDRHSLNPLRQVLNVLGESVEAIAYDPLGHYHFPDATLPIYGKLEQYRAAVEAVTRDGARELFRFEREMLKLYNALSQVPTLHLRGDWRVFPMLLSQYLPAMMQLLPQLPVVRGSVGDVMDRTVSNHWVRRLIDLECFLLSGLKAEGTVAPEMAFMYGERDRSVIDYPIGGSGAIVAALVRGLEKYGGTLRLRSHVNKILIENQTAIGVELKSGENIRADVVISNATIWDTVQSLIEPGNIPRKEREQAKSIETIPSFMHLHLGIRSDGLGDLTGHHVVVQDEARDISDPGNTCMVSIPTVWDSSMAPAGHHAVHAYTLEPYTEWQYDDRYSAKKTEKAQVLYRALERVIPDIRERVTLELIGTPLTHSRFLRRYRGTYGPAIPPDRGMFPGCRTSIKHLFRVGDSTIPGIGIPAVAASGILCANSLVPPRQTDRLVQQLYAQ